MGEFQLSQMKSTSSLLVVFLGFPFASPFPGFSFASSLILCSVCSCTAKLAASKSNGNQYKKVSKM